MCIRDRFHEEAKKDPALDDEGRAWFKKIEDGDAEALEIFGWFKEITLKEVGKVYDLLGVKFDSYAGESFYNDKMQPVIDELREKNMLELSDGAYVCLLYTSGKYLPDCSQTALETGWTGSPLRQTARERFGQTNKSPSSPLPAGSLQWLGPHTPKAAWEVYPDVYKRQHMPLASGRRKVLHPRRLASAMEMLSPRSSPNTIWET